MKLTTRNTNIYKSVLTLSFCFLLAMSLEAREPEATSKSKSIEATDVELDLKNVKGFVVDEFGEPVAGAIVEALGSNKNAITNTEGKYTILALKDDILKFSQIGMAEKEEKITSSRIVNVALSIE